IGDWLGPICTTELSIRWLRARVLSPSLKSRPQVQQKQALAAFFISPAAGRFLCYQSLFTKHVPGSGGLRASLLYENILRAVWRRPRPPALHLLLTERHGPAEELDDALRELAGFEEEMLAGQTGACGAISRVAVSPAGKEPGRVLVRHAVLLALPAGARPP